MMTNTSNHGNGIEQETDEVVGYSGLSGGVIANIQLRPPAVMPDYVPGRSTGEEIPQVKLQPVPFAGRSGITGDV